MRGSPFHAESLLKELEAQRVYIDDAIQKLKPKWPAHDSRSARTRVVSAATKQRISETLEAIQGRKKETPESQADRPLEGNKAGKAIREER